ncbi:MAG: hypothetical protein A3F77_17740 [Betaproteobacteria bacterium RIFCSPLOWO2_12_FULL_67_28]|nr:MAG: hypothetical protein A3F77_17740 [Betaproteobacteria bacterium RIFCSPLOWO2_12_FULL_67_28]
MTTLRQAVKNFWNDEDGASAIEYALLAALIAIVIVGGSIALGTNINTMFQKIANCIAAPNTTTCAL